MDSHSRFSPPPPPKARRGRGCIPSRQREPHVCMGEGPAHNCLFSSSWGKSKNLEKAKFENAMCLKIFLRKPSLRTPRALKWVLILENACFGEPSEPKAYLRSLRACALKRLPFLLGISVSSFFCQFLRSYMTSGQLNRLQRQYLPYYSSFQFLQCSSSSSPSCPSFFACELLLCSKNRHLSSVSYLK